MSARPCNVKIEAAEAAPFSSTPFDGILGLGFKASARLVGHDPANSHFERICQWA